MMVRCMFRIGDHSAPRASFQILIALCATPRFLLLLVQWLAHRYPLARPPKSAGAQLPPPVHGDGGGGIHHSDGVSKSTLDEGFGAVQGDVTSRGASIEDVTCSLAEALEEEVGASSLPDIELAVGIARTFCW